MASKGWRRRSKARVASRLGRKLSVRFSSRTSLGPAGIATRVAKVGDDAWVAFEFERRHARPADSVLRYWPWLDRTRRRLVIVHVIAPDARRRAGPRAELTLWLGALMERVLPGRFTYCQVELGTRRERAQLDAARHAIALLRSPHPGRRLAPGL